LKIAVSGRSPQEKEERTPSKLRGKIWGQIFILDIAGEIRMMWVYVKCKDLAPPKKHFHFPVRHLTI